MVNHPESTSSQSPSKTRSEYLHGKTELSDVDIINILDLPVEKRSANIAKSKLLYQESDVLCNEIPCLIVLNQLKKTTYLLPYEYAANKYGAAITSADALKSNTFTDFKRVFNKNLRHSLEKGSKQGRDIFFLLNNENIDYKSARKQLEDFVNSRKLENKEAEYLFFSEKDFVCYSFESDKDGFVRELSKHVLKEIRATISSKPLTPNQKTDAKSVSSSSNANVPQENSDVNDLKQIRLANADKPLIPNQKTDIKSVSSSDNFNIAQENSDVNKYENELFNSFLLRGEISSLEILKDIENRQQRYFNALNSLEKLNHLISSKEIKESNNKFVKKHKESRFYKDVQNLFVETSNQLQEKPMENQNIEPSKTEFSNYDSQEYLQNKLTTQMILDQEDKEQMEAISATMKSATKDFMDLNATPITEIPFTKENYDKLFPFGIVQSPVEKVKLGEHQFEKLDAKDRGRFLLASYQTLATPDIVIEEVKEDKVSHNYIKSFVFDEKTKTIQDIVVNIDGENISISAHPRDVNNVLNKIKTPDQLVYAAAEVGRMIEQRVQNELEIVNPTRADRLSTISVPLNKEYSMENALSTINAMENSTNAAENSNPQYQETEERTMKSTENFESKEYWKNQFQYDNAEPFKAIDDYLEKGIRPKNNEFIFKNVPEVLKYSGISKNDIILTTGIINKAKNTHNLSDEEIKNAILSLSTPVAIFDSDKNKSENNTLSIINITDIEAENNKPIAITINLDNQRKGYEQKYLINEIRSIHDRTLIAKNGVNIVEEWAKAGLLRYVDDKKISNLVKEREDSFLLPLAKLDKNNINLSSKIVNSTAYQEIRTFSEFTEQQKAMEKEYQEYLGTISPDEKSSRRIDSGSVKQEENPSLQMEPGLIKKFNEMKKAIESREKQESQTAAEKTESAGSRKAENHEKPKVDLIKKAAKDFISAIKNGTAPFLNSTEKDFGKISLRPAAIVNASNGLPFSGEAQLLAQIYYQQQKMEGEIVTTFEGAKESGTFIANKPESKKNFVLANKTEQQQKEIIQKTRYFMPEACDEPDKIYAHALQKQRPQKISDYRDLIRHFENIPNGQKEISDLRIRIAHEHLKEIQSRFAMKKERILTVDEINERKKILQDYFKNLPEKHRESEKNAFENTFGLTLNPEEIFKTNLEGNFKNKKFEDVVKSNEKLTDQANRKLSSFIQKNSMEDKKLSEILHEEYNAQSKEEKETSKKLKIEAIGISEPETYLGKYLAACNANAEFVTDEDTIKAVQSNLVKKLEENYRVEKYGILKEIGQQAQRISNETTSKIAFDKAHSNKNTKEKKIEKEIGPIGMGN